VSSGPGMGGMEGAGWGGVGGGDFGETIFIQGG
jgi:hypothetical protein